MTNEQAALLAASQILARRSYPVGSGDAAAAVAGLAEELVVWLAEADRRAGRRPEVWQMPDAPE